MTYIIPPVQYSHTWGIIIYSIWHRTTCVQVPVRLLTRSEYSIKLKETQT